MIRVALADDQALVRAGLARILAPEDGFDVVAQCADGDELLTAVLATGPDLVVMDVRMPGTDGIAATRRLAALPDTPPVLIVTTFDEDDVLWGAIEAGATGFILKDATADALLAAAKAVAGGGAWFDAAVTPRLLAAYRRTVAPRRRSLSRLDALSDREHDVLHLVARGANNTEIGRALHVSEGTVKSHIGSIFSKLGVRDRGAVIVYAYDHGVVSPGAGTDPGSC